MTTSLQRHLKWLVIKDLCCKLVWAMGAVASYATTPAGFTAFKSKTGAFKNLFS